MKPTTTINKRIKDLREDKDLTQKKLCEIADITPSQLSRIEKGEIQTISSDILIKLAKVFDVSTDYILGLTHISSQKNYDISQLGLSEGAVKNILQRNADINVLNVLLENKRFCEMLRLVKDYFMNTISAGIMARNELMNLATSSLGDFIKENPSQKSEALKDIRIINSTKLKKHETEIEKIRELFIIILKEIKKEIEKTAETGQKVDTALLQQMMSEIQEHKPKSVEEVSEIVANMVRNSANLDDENTELFKRIVEQIIMFTGNQEQSDVE